MQQDSVLVIDDSRPAARLAYGWETGKPSVIVNVPPADGEQVAHVSKNRETGKEMCTG